MKCFFPRALPSLLSYAIDVSSRPGSLAVREGGGREPACPLLVAFEDGFSFYSPSTGRRVSAAARGTVDEYEQLPGTRLNDGRCGAGELFFPLTRESRVRSIGFLFGCGGMLACEVESDKQLRLIPFY